MGGALCKKKVKGTFSKKKKSRITDQDRAILELKTQRDQLRLYQRKIDLEQDKLRELAKECLRSGRKDKARLILMKKRRQESFLKKTEGQIETLEKMANDIEVTQMDMAVAQGLKIGNEALKMIHNLLSFEEVERIMEETQEGIEYQRELDSMLTQFGSTPEDEQHIMDELNELLGDVELPEVLTTELPKVGRQEKKTSIKQAQPMMAS